MNNKGEQQLLFRVRFTLCKFKNEMLIVLFDFKREHFASNPIRLLVMTGELSMTLIHIITHVPRDIIIIHKK